MSTIGKSSHVIRLLGLAEENARAAEKAAAASKRLLRYVEQRVDAELKDAASLTTNREMQYRAGLVHSQPAAGPHHAAGASHLSNDAAQRAAAIDRARQAYVKALR